MVQLPAFSQNVGASGDILRQLISNNSVVL